MQDGNELGHDGREQKAMPVEAVDIDIARSRDNPRTIVREGGPRGGTKRENLGFAKRRVERIGRVQKLERRAQGDGSCLLAFDYRRPDHIAAFVPGHDVEGKAWVQQPHRSRERHLAAPHHDPLAAHAA